MIIRSVSDEKQMESVLAKLMGFDHPKSPPQPRQRPAATVLSPRYFESLASVNHHLLHSSSSSSTNSGKLAGQRILNSRFAFGESPDTALVVNGRRINEAEGIPGSRQGGPVKRKNVEYLGGGSKVSQGIARQITRQVQESAWMKCLDNFKSAHRIAGEENGGNGNMSPQQQSNVALSPDNSISLPLSSDLTPVTPISRTRRRFSVHKDWCLNLVGDAATEFNRSAEVDKTRAEEDTEVVEDAMTPDFETRDTKSVDTKEGDTMRSSGSGSTSRSSTATTDLEESFSSDDASSSWTIYFDSVDDDEFDYPDDVDLSWEEDVVVAFTDSAKHDETIDGHSCDKTHNEEEQRVEEKETGKIEERSSREYQYMVNVLSEHSRGPPHHHNNIDLQLLGNLHDHLVLDPLVFDKLEKTVYAKQNSPPSSSWLRSERRLLFDQINHKLTELRLDPYAQMSMSISQCSAIVRHQQSSRVREEVWGFVVRSMNTTYEEVVGREWDWVKVREGVCSVVEDIEKHLVDELIQEIIV